jgi:hypothetical protein
MDLFVVGVATLGAALELDASGPLGFWFELFWTFGGVYCLNMLGKMEVVAVIWGLVGDFAGARLADDLLNNLGWATCRRGPSD